MSAKSYVKAFDAEMGRRFAARLDEAIQLAAALVESEERPESLAVVVEDVAPGDYAELSVNLGWPSDGGTVIKIDHADTVAVIADRIGIEHARLCSYARDERRA